MNEIQEALCEPFHPDCVKWKPGATKGNSALALAYIDARDVMNRLDDVVGVGNWSDAYEVLAGGDVMCRLSVRIGDEWITKSDVGAIGDSKDQGNDIKTAFSDALKRAAVKFGIGRYLYALDNEWVPYDERSRRITKPPTLPEWALPKDSAVADWGHFLESDPSVAIFNNWFKNKFKPMAEGATKDSIRTMISEHAKLASLDYDTKSESFKVKPG